MKYTALLTLFFLCSCGAASKLRRAERLISKAEAKGATWRVDTIFQEIEVIVPSIKIDTVVRDVNFADTITVIKDSIVTKVKVDTHTKTVYVSTECPERVIIKKVPVVVNKTIQAKSWLKWWHLFISVIFGYLCRFIWRGGIRNPF